MIQQSSKRLVLAPFYTSKMFTFIVRGNRSIQYIRREFSLVDLLRFCFCRNRCVIKNLVAVLSNEGRKFKFEVGNNTLSVIFIKKTRV